MQKRAIGRPTNNTTAHCVRLLPEHWEFLKRKGKPSAVLRFLIALAMCLEYMTEGDANERAG